MARFVKVQNDFSTGRLSPLLLGRQDIAQYDGGMFEALNAVVSTRGPVSRRTGSEYIADTKATTTTVLIPFQFDEVDAFILEFGNNYIRFYKNNGQVESSPSVPLELATTYTSSEVKQLSYVQFGNTLFIAHPDHAPAQLIRNSDTDWTLEDIPLLPPPTEEKGDTPNTTLTPGATTGLGVTFTLGSGYFEPGDVGRQIINLVGTGRGSIVGFTSTTQVTVDIIEDFPSTSAIAGGDWKLDLSPIAELEPSGTKLGSIITIDADTIGTATTLNCFRTGDLGRYILMNGGVVQIVQVVSASQVTGEVLKSLNDDSETAIWSLEDEVWSSSNGYPRAVGLSQQRLVFGGTATRPQTVWLSESGIFTAFGVGPDDEDGIEVDLSSSRVNTVNWISSSRDLIVGTAGGESTLAGTGGILTPSTITQTARTYYGSSRQNPVTIGSETLFVQRSQRKIRSLGYDFNIDGYSGQDLTFLAEDITENLAGQMAYAQNPESLLYVVDDAGDLLVCAYDRQQPIIGWTKFTTDGKYKSVQVITEGNVDQVWVIVERTINAVTKQYVELFYSGDQTIRNSGFSDSFLTLSNPVTITGITQANPGVVTAAGHGFSDGDKVKIIDVVGMTEVNGKTYVVANKTASTFELTTTTGANVDTSGFTAYGSGGKVFKLVSSVSGLGHLEGETVQVKVDGASHPDKTVSSGSITLDIDGYEVVVGLKYTTQIDTLPPDIAGPMGSLVATKQKNASVAIRVDRSTVPTLDGQFKPSRNTNDPMDERVPLFTGVLEYPGRKWDKDGQLSITADAPLPLTLLAIYATMNANMK